MDTNATPNGLDTLYLYAENNDFRIETDENNTILILQNTISKHIQAGSLPEIQGFYYYFSVQHLRETTIFRVVYTATTNRNP